LQEASCHKIHPGNQKPLASHYHTRNAVAELRVRQRGETGFPDTAQ
jgi:hypothetical protein